jgi:hypothetical protein
MSDWYDDPPGPTEFAGIRLFRIPTGKIYQGVITSPTMVGRYTHYVRRRTIPHFDRDCPECLTGSEARWHGYISVYSLGGHAHSVLELTALAAGPIKEFQERHGSLRGSEIWAQRMGAAPNSPVQTRVNAADHDLRTIPQPVDLRAFLCTIWRIPLDGQADRPAPPTDKEIAAIEAAKGNGDSR